MTKYVDSFKATITQTSAGTSYSSWFDISWATEIYGYVVQAFTETVTGDESTTPYIERKTPTSTQTVLTFTTVTADATEEEKYASAHTYDGNAAIGADQKLGTRVRFKVTSTGSAWTTDQSITTTCYIYAKRN